MTAELVARQDELRRFARRLAADSHLAEDLLQELNLLALRRPPVEAPCAWMKGVLRRLFRGELRRAERRRRHERCAARTNEGEGLAQRGELERVERERVFACLARLAEPYRSTLVARFVEGRTPSQVAARAGVPLRTVHTRTSRGLALLRRTLAPDQAGRGRAERESRALWRLGARPVGMLSTLAGLAACGLFVLTAHPSGPAGTTPVSGAVPASEYELLIFPLHDGERASAACVAEAPLHAPCAEPETARRPPRSLDPSGRRKS